MPIIRSDLSAVPRVSWPFFAAAASILMLGAAHGFETIGGYAPCELCLKQREVYWVALAVAVIAVIFASTRRARPVRRGFDALLGLIFLVGFVIAGYHAGVEWKWWPGPASCTGTRATVTAADMARLLSGAKERMVRCDEAAWRLFGISMAGYNTLISAGLAIASFVAAARGSRTS